MGAVADGVVQVPDLVRRRVAHPGAAGRDWLSGLPDLIADLERRWSITVGQPLAGGTASYVARADTADGAAALLKLSVPDPEFADQVRTIQRANENSGVLGGGENLAAEVAALKQQPGADIVVMGSARLVNWLLREGSSTSCGCWCTRLCWAAEESGRLGVAGRSPVIPAELPSA